MEYDAILVVSFGGPEAPEDVVPFLQNVLRGRNVPPERIAEVAAHYEHFGGRSPINDQNRRLIQALKASLEERGPHLPVYWGNRNWHPFLAETLGRMRNDGIKRAIAFVTSAFSSYSGCRQYREDIEGARTAVGAGAPEIDKLRVFYNHPGFVEPTIDNARGALEGLGPDAALIYTAHSIPLAMAQTSRYEDQLREACRLVSAALGRPDSTLVFQSRSGPPAQPWLGPDIGDWLRTNRPAEVAIVPIGFISDHMEVLYDLDTEARSICDDLGIRMSRAATVGVDPRFISMVRDLILERGDPSYPRLYLGDQGPSHDVCAANCCPPPVRTIARS